MLRGCDPGRVDLHAERQGEGVFEFFIDRTGGIGRRPLHHHRHTGGAQQLAFGAFARHGAEKGFLLANVFHQAGEVKLHRVFLLLQHAIHAPVAQASQQQCQAQEHGKPHVQAQ
ncbi:hypothetical protein [Pseudomonas sp. PS01300]|uniref:hypothetical protein n=1 Tax=Pseudomonas sp. PS01300 TaxID=2991436 RepID=UPI00249C634C|nr:hypothetical protein [Pseudomonas sp. PS01300]